MDNNLKIGFLSVKDKDFFENSKKKSHILGSVQHLTQKLTLREESLEVEDGKKATSLKDGDDVSRDGARKRA